MTDAPGGLPKVNDSSLHHAIITFFLERQRPPTIRELASRFGGGEADLRHALRALAGNHGVVLHPTTDEIWVCHPFSAAPTTCVVRSGTRKWWGNCMWCSLGLAHLAGGDCSIETRLGAIDEPETVQLGNGRLVDTEFVVHFPIPMARAWDNVIYTCAVMLLFRNEAQVDEWCDVRGIPKGDVVPIATISAFAAEWYGRHADANWTKWTSHEAAEIFRRHGLSGPVWSLSTDDQRF